MSIFKAEKEVATDRIENVIGQSASFNGHFQADGGLRIDGVFEGTIETAGNVIVGESGKVIADITARNVSVSGAVKGNVITTGRLQVMSTGRVWGDISVASLLIDEGGLFHGKSIMQNEAEIPQLEAPRPSGNGQPRKGRREPDVVVE